MNTTTTVIPDITIRRTYQAPRERVFAAWTKPELIKEWMCPQGFTIPEVSYDVRVGGAYRLVMLAPDGDRYVVTGAFLDVREPEHLSYSWTWEEEPGEPVVTTRVSLDFIAHGKTTELVLTHSGFLAQDSRDRHESGWLGIVDRCPAVL